MVARYDGSVRTLNDMDIRTGVKHRSRRPIAISVGRAAMRLPIPATAKKSPMLKTNGQSLAPISGDQPGRLNRAAKKGEKGEESGSRLMTCATLGLCTRRVTD